MADLEKTPLPVRPRRSARPRCKLCLVLLVLMIVYLLSPWAHYGIPKKTFEKTSPSGQYRVEYYSPRYCPYAAITYHDPFFIKVYNTELKRSVYTSDLDEGLAMFPDPLVMWPEEFGSLDISYGIQIPEKQLQ